MGKGQRRALQEGTRSGKLAIMVRLKSPQMKETSPNDVMTEVTIILDGFVAAVNKNNSSNKFVMMVAIITMTTIII